MTLPRYCFVDHKDWRLIMYRIIMLWCGVLGCNVAFAGSTCPALASHSSVCSISRSSESPDMCKLSMSESSSGGCSNKLSSSSTCVNYYSSASEGECHLSSSNRNCKIESGSSSTISFSSSSKGLSATSSSSASNTADSSSSEKYLVVTSSDLSISRVLSSNKEISKISSDSDLSDISSSKVTCINITPSLPGESSPYVCSLSKNETKCYTCPAENTYIYGLIVKSVPTPNNTVISYSCGSSEPIVINKVGVIYRCLAGETMNINFNNTGDESNLTWEIITLNDGSSSYSNVPVVGSASILLNHVETAIISVSAVLANTL